MVSVPYLFALSLSLLDGLALEHRRGAIEDDDWTHAQREQRAYAVEHALQVSAGEWTAVFVRHRFDELC